MLTARSPGRSPLTHKVSRPHRCRVSARCAEIPDEFSLIGEPGGAYHWFALRSHELISKISPDCEVAICGEYRRALAPMPRYWSRHYFHDEWPDTAASASLRLRGRIRHGLLSSAQQSPPPAPGLASACTSSSSAWSPALPVHHHLSPRAVVADSCATAHATVAGDEANVAA